MKPPTEFRVVIGATIPLLLWLQCGHLGLHKQFCMMIMFRPLSATCWLKMVAAHFQWSHCGFFWWCCLWTPWNPATLGFCTMVVASNSMHGRWVTRWHIHRSQQWFRQGSCWTKWFNSCQWVRFLFYYYFCLILFSFVWFSFLFFFCLLFVRNRQDFLWCSSLNPQFSIAASQDYILLQKSTRFFSVFPGQETDNWQMPFILFVQEQKLENTDTKNRLSFVP